MVLKHLENEEFRQRVFENSPMPIVVMDGETHRYIDCNSAAVKIYGFPSREATVGKTPLDVSAPFQYDGSPSAEKAFIFINKAIQEGALVFEWKHKRPDGTFWDAEVHLLSFRIKDRQLLQFMLIDITERKRAGDELKRSNELLSLFIKQSPIYAFIKSVTPDESKVLYASENYRDMIGTTSTDMVGKSMDELFPPEFAAKITADDWKVVSEGKILQLEEDLNNRNFITIKFPIKQEQHHLLAGYTIDITDRKRAEEALRQSEARFKTLFMSISDGFYLSEILYDDSGKPYDYLYLEANPTFGRILGLDRGRIVGKRYRELVPVDTTQWLENYLRVAGTGEPSTYSFYSDEYKMHFETFAYKTAINQIAVFVRDVTERKRTENALQNMQKLESLGLLAGGIAHDFNNLLGGIFGYIDLAAERTGEKSVAGNLAKALGTIDRARGLTRQLLTFAKGGVPIKKSERFSPFIQETVRFALSGSKCSCDFHIPPDLWMGEFDRNQISQVIDNIVINAQQAMPLGGVVEVAAENVVLGEKAHATLAAGNFVKLSILDHGIGMPKEILPRIFDPFFTTKPKGHGLGLATCHSIINQHGGCIDVESEPGKGSVFHVYLPAEPESNGNAAAESTAMHRGTGTILVMDDEEVIREIISEMLKSFGYSVISTANGSEAIDVYLSERAAQRAISGMIFDLTIPGGKGGKEIIGEIRKIDPNIPAFVASGYADHPVMAHPASYGFTDSICKPFKKSELAEMLGRHIRHLP